MGNSDLDISGSLTRLTGHLVKWPSGEAEVYVHAPGATTQGHHVVVCVWKARDGRVFKGTGTARRAYDAFLRAVVELGEVLCVDGRRIVTRNGMAGGLFGRMAVERAKAELIERDAFLFHYRGRVPFAGRFPISSGMNPPGDHERIVLYRLCSAEPGVHCLLATDEASANGRSRCLFFGMAANRNEHAAAAKAIGEYACMKLDHAMRPKWCEAVYEGRVAPSRLPDMHHAASRDGRNLARFRELCERTNKVAPRRAVDELRWRIEEIPSPLRYFRFVRAECAELLELEFGRPEPDSPSDGVPLFHPAW